VSVLSWGVAEEMGNNFEGVGESRLVLVVDDDAWVMAAKGRVNCLGRCLLVCLVCLSPALSAGVHAYTDGAASDPAAPSVFSLDPAARRLRMKR
jgi:hypothetical protein